MSSALTMRLCLTISVCFADLNRLVTKCKATASPMPVYSSGQGDPSDAMRGEVPSVAGGLGLHAPTSGLLNTRSVGTSDSRHRVQKRESRGVWAGAERAAAMAEVPSNCRRSRSVKNSVKMQTSAVTPSMIQEALKDRDCFGGS